MREFRGLFTSKDEGINRALDELVNALPKIPISIQKRMNKTVTKSEIAKAIKELTSRKSPGVDGLGSINSSPTFLFPYYVTSLLTLSGGPYYHPLCNRHSLSSFQKKKKKHGP